ncbi:MAG: Asp23/Gls24 family envelope stress response protein, partial [Clostridiales Family XIII bacterium]|nr:Asp23/Gls24 family envelope stress response protein [Clostridiales Family XIII bacterium]
MTTDKGGSEYGAVKISYDVIVAYVSDAVLNTRGVVDLSGGLSDTLSQTILGKESRYRGVKIDEHDGVYNIDIYVIVAYGVQIPETAWNIQRNV